MFFVELVVTSQTLPDPPDFCLMRAEQFIALSDLQKSDNQNDLNVISMSRSRSCVAQHFFPRSMASVRRVLTNSSLRLRALQL